MLKLELTGNTNSHITTIIKHLWGKYSIKSFRPEDSRSAEIFE